MTAISGEIVRTLRQNEEIVRKGIASFVEVGLALKQIKEEKQYKADGFDTWEEYLAGRWKMQPRQATRYITASVVSENLDGPIGPKGKPAKKPKRESVARAVAESTKDPEEQREVWQEATAEKEEPTAKDVKAAAAKVLGQKERPQKPSASNGKTTVAGFDRKPIESQYGAIARAIDDMASKSGCNNTFEHKAATRALNAALESFISFANNVDAVMRARSK